MICFCFPFPVTFQVFFPPQFLFQKEKFVELQVVYSLPFDTLCFFLLFFFFGTVIVLCPETCRLGFFTPICLLDFGQDLFEILFQVQILGVTALHELPEFCHDSFRSSSTF